MTKKILVLFFLIAAFISACDPPGFHPTDKGNLPETATPTKQVIDSDKMSPTGFYWPTKHNPEVMMPYLASGCEGKEPLIYSAGTYHTGVDIKAAFGEEVVAIADGIIYDVSLGGWNKDGSEVNKGVLIKHKLIDGSEFVAIYGHVITEFVRGKTYPVKAGEKIGTIGDWGNQDHLHFTISTIVPAKDPYGIMPCPKNDEDFDPNGTEDPIVWLDTKYPGPYSRGPIISAPGGNGTDDGPTIITTIISATKISEPDGMVMMYVPEGEFLMGDNSHTGYSYPQHKVYLDTFWIDKTEVTEGMYAKCLEAGGCDYFDFTNKDLQGNNPIEASWKYANAYCAWVGKRLPTEAEWEKAARGTDGRKYPWGDQEPDETLANFLDGYENGHPVDVNLYPEGASPYGVLNMAGNVEEWVVDWWGDDYYKNSPYQNPTGPSSGDGYSHVIRGGSFRAGRSEYLLTYARDLGAEGSTRAGFRCVLSKSVIPTTDLATLAFGYNLEYLLTYDKNSWKIMNLPNGFEIIKLINASDCSMQQNLGRGAPEWWQRKVTQEAIGPYDFRVETWTDTNTNQIVFVTYNIDDKNISISIEPGSEPSACLEAAREVINYSVLNDFGLVE